MAKATELSTTTTEECTDLVKSLVCPNLLVNMSLENDLKFEQLAPSGEPVNAELLLYQFWKDWFISLEGPDLKLQSSIFQTYDYAIDIYFRHPLGMEGEYDLITLPLGRIFMNSTVEKFGDFYFEEDGNIAQLGYIPDVKKWTQLTFSHHQQQVSSDMDAGASTQDLTTDEVLDYIILHSDPHS